MDQKTINTTGTGDKNIHDVETTARTQVFDYTLFVSGAATVIVKDEAGTEFARYTLGAAGQVNAGPIGGGLRRFVAVGNLLLNASADVTITGHFTHATG